VSVEEQLQREAAGRRVGAGAAIGAVLLPLAAQLIFQALSAGASSSAPGAVLERPAFYRDNAVPLIGGAVLVGAGYLLTGLALARLYQATRFRRAETPGVARVMAYGGPVALALAVVSFQVIVTLASADYLANRPGDYFAARAITSSTPVIVTQAIGQAGTLALAFAFVLISLNAMRAGLLTRFMGILGVLVGTFVIIQIAPFPIVQTFWLLGLAIILAGRRPGGDPPAWRTGREEPWPSPQQVAEERRRAAGAEPDPEPEPEPASVAAGGAEHPSSHKRRRKRRR
jgi:hypothetical protein